MRRWPDIAHLRVEEHPDAEFAVVVGEVAQHVFAVGQEQSRVVTEEEAIVVANERVPVVTQVEVLVQLAGVPLVNADQSVVTRVLQEEVAYRKSLP